MQMDKTKQALMYKEGDFIKHKDLQHTLISTFRKKPHELQWLEEVYSRNGLSDSEIKQYQNLKRGYEGECELDRICDFYIQNNELILNDLTLKNKLDATQIDKLLLIDQTLYVMEVKFYRGDYVFENNEWRVGEIILSNNIFEQLRRAVRITKNILHEHGLKIQVKGVLIFMNPNSSVEIKDQVSETVLHYSEVPSWLFSISMKFNASHSIDYQWKKVLKSAVVEPFRSRNICDESRFNNLTKGIRCPQCNEFKMKESRHCMTCACGHTEVKEIAYIRTICEYGLITHDRLITACELIEFFGKDLNRPYLSRIIKKHFKKIQKRGNHTTYLNKGVQFKYWIDDSEYFEKINSRKYWNRK